MAYNNIFQTVENEVMNLLFAYANKRRGFSITEDYFQQLAVSMYAWVKGERASENVLRILNDEIFNLKDYFSDDEIKLLTDNYMPVIEFCLDGYTKDVLTSEYFEFSQPKELTAFICQSLDIPEGSSVYLPFAGMCSEAIGMANVKIDGEELSERAWALGQIRLDAHGIDAHIENGNSFENLKKQDEIYDYVIFNPSFNLHDGKDGESLYDAVRMVFDNKLKQDGYLCCVLPISFVFGGSRQEVLRKFLVDNGYIRSVITLPKIFAPFTNVNTVLLVAQKKQAIHFTVVDGREFATKNTQETGRQVFKYTSLIDSLINQDEKFMKVLTKDQLNKNYNLDPSRHLFELPEIKPGEKLYSLKDLVKIVGKSIGIKSSDYKESSFLIKRLSDNYINCDIEKSPVGEKKPRRRYEVSTPCIVAQVIFGKVKVGQVLEEVPNCIIETLQDAFFMQPRKEIILDKYLLKMLTSEFVATQVNALCTGAVMPHLSVADFFSLRIPVPSLETQNESLMEDLHEGLSEGEKKLAQELEEYKRDVHIKKHAVGQILFGLNSNWELLNTVRECTGGKFDENLVLGEEDNSMSVKEILDSIGDFLKAVNKAINAFTAGEEEIYKEENVSLAPFFIEYRNTHKNSVFQIDYQPSNDDFADKDIPAIIYDKDGNPTGVSDTDFVIRKGEPTKAIKFSQAALERIMDDICANALEYGFKGREDENNRIKIEIQTKDGCYVVFVSNNGHPAKPGLNSEDVFKFGITSSGHRNRHSGIGGYEIKKLMERFEGKVEFVNSPTEAFPVAYKLVFTKTNIINTENLSLDMDIEDYIEEQKTQEEMDRLLIEDYIEEQKAQDAMAELEIKSYIEEQKAQDELAEMEIEDYIEEQKAQDELTEMEIEDYIEEQNALYEIEPTDEEIKRNTQHLLEIFRRNKNNSIGDNDGKN